MELRKDKIKQKEMFAEKVKSAVSTKVLWDKVTKKVGGRSMQFPQFLDVVQ